MPLLIFKLQIGIDLFIAFDTVVSVGDRAAVIRVVTLRQPVVDQKLPGGNTTCRREQLDLLGRIVWQAGSPLERVEVEFEEGLFGEAGRALFHGQLAAGIGFHGARGAGCCCSLNIAGDQLKAAVLVTRARLIDDTDPGADIEKAFIGIIAICIHQVVIRPPCHSLGLISDPGEVLATTTCADVPHQRWSRNKTAREFRETNVAVAAHRMNLPIFVTQYQTVGGTE